MSKVVNSGDVVRLYGYTGTFVAGQPYLNLAGYPQIEMMRDGVVLFPAQLQSIVEINGVPVPLESCPLNYPAADYPHEPMFDYQDGPQSNGMKALANWRERK